VLCNKTTTAYEKGVNTMPCTTILAGKKATHDGSTMIARNSDGDCKIKNIIINQPKDQPKVFHCVLSHLDVELPDNPMRYSSAPSVDQSHGVWPAFGINEANVAMTATETTTSNPRVYAADPYVDYDEEKDIPGGIGEADLCALVLPYIHSAREGVLRLGMLHEKYGTYEDNGIGFADKDEVWWFETIGGHHWIAKKVPDDRVVIMPNQFGLDTFDFEDAYGAAKENLCSADLKEFTEKNFLYTGKDWNKFNPRLAYGSHSDGDHIYNTPRAWYMARYFMERSYKWDGDGADYTPLSNDIPWSFVPERKVTIEDIHYVLGSHYQGTPYDPYDKNSPEHGKFRTIGVPGSNVCGIQQIRGYLPEKIQGVEWVTMGGSGFTACLPLYTNVDAFPAYLSDTPEYVTDNSMYWQSRLIAALTDAHYGSGIIYSERYQKRVLNEGGQILAEYDARVLAGDPDVSLAEANDKILAMVKKASDKTLKQLLDNASEHMKIKYHRGDN